jgi:hypothetical protein
MRHLFILFLTTSQFLFASDPIGRVNALEGRVNASSDAIGNRTLKKNSLIYEEDIIKTEKQGRVQILFSDGGVMNLIPETEFKIISYKYKKPDEKDESFGDLLAGGFRAVTGSIAKKNPQGYKVRTPAATIGIRGTIPQARIVDSTTFFGAMEGRAYVENNTGRINIGLGADTNFAMVAGINEPISLNIQRPDELELSAFQVEDGANLEDVQSAGSPPPESLTESAPDAAPSQADILQTGDSGASIQSGC